MKKLTSKIILCLTVIALTWIYLVAYTPESTTPDPIMGSSEVVSQVLPPGCHILNFRVKGKAPRYLLYNDNVKIGSLFNTYEDAAKYAWLYHRFVENNDTYGYWDKDNKEYVLIWKDMEVEDE